MTDDIRPGVSVLSGDTIAFELSADVVPNDWEDHSFKSVTGRPEEDDIVTVSMEAGRTRLKVRHVPATFDGFRYFPRKPENYPEVDYRGDVGDTTIDFELDDPDNLPDLHPVKNMTLYKLIDEFETGMVTTAPP